MEPTSIATIAIGVLCLIGILLVVVLLGGALIVAFVRDPSRAAAKSIRKSMKDAQIKEEVDKQFSATGKAIGYEVTSPE